AQADARHHRPLQPIRHFRPHRGQHAARADQVHRRLIDSAMALPPKRWQRLRSAVPTVHTGPRSRLGRRMGELADELRTLRKGAGVLAAPIAPKVGPALRRRCGIADGDSQADIRRKIESWLRSAIDQLPADLRAPMLAAFALDGDASGLWLKERME